LPIPGERLNVVALVEDQVSVTDAPLWIVVGEACKFAVGFAGGAAGGGGGGGGGAATGFLQAALRVRIASNEPNKIRKCVRFRIVILLPPLTIYVSFGRECNYDLEPLSDTQHVDCTVLA
jgi:hypothetical protein